MLKSLGKVLFGILMYLYCIVKYIFDIYGLREYIIDETLEPINGGKL